MASKSTQTLTRGCLSAAAVVALAVVAVGLILWFVLDRSPLVTAPAAPPARLIVQDVTVIDVVSGQAVKNRDIFVKDGRITRVVPHGEAKLEEPAQLVDGTGRFAIPGLVDSHCHVTASSAPPWVTALPDVDLNLERLLYSGVTTVFDPGAMMPDIFELRDEIDRGERLGPRILAAGPIFTSPGAHPIPILERIPMISGQLIENMARQIDDPAEAEPAVAALVEHRPTMIKMVVDALPPQTPHIDEERGRAIIAAAGKHDLRVAAHIGTTQDAIDAATWGANIWIHGVYKERISDEAIKVLADFDMPMVPTMVVFRLYGEFGRDIYEPTDLDLETLTADELQDLMVVPEETTADTEPKMRLFLQSAREERESALDNVGRLHRAGVTMLAGSDSQGGVIHGPALHRELDLLRRAGLSKLEVLRSATLYPARFFDQSDEPSFGIIAEGKRADLVLLEANPLENPKAIHQIDAVIARGVLLERHPVPEGD